jgi:hypothetical protein
MRRSANLGERERLSLDCCKCGTMARRLLTPPTSEHGRVAARSFLSLPREAWGGSAGGRGGGRFSAIAVDIGNSLKHPHPTHRSLRSRCATLPTASQGREKRQRVRRHTASRGRDKKEPGIPAVVPAFAATTRHSPRSQLSSPGLTGRPSIPEALVINREATAYWFPAFAGMTTGVAARP